MESKRNGRRPARKPLFQKGVLMDKIEALFNDNFAHWNICLAPEDIAQRRRGKIVKAGWAIWYLFRSDAHGEYFDYYASHRMTSDSHVRIYADGKREDLPTICSCRMASEDPEEDARLEAESYAKNQRVAELLESKGFGLSGDEPGGVQINRFLSLENVDESEEDA